MPRSAPTTSDRVFSRSRAEAVIARAAPGGQGRAAEPGRAQLGRVQRLPHRLVQWENKMECSSLRHSGLAHHVGDALALPQKDWIVTLRAAGRVVTSPAF
jgi:hypothetical protein